MTRTLYRDPVKGKIGGVCAGIAEYFNLEVWIVRLITISAFLLGFVFIVVVAYIAAMLIIEKKPDNLNTSEAEYHVKQNPWQQGKPAQRVLFEVESKINQLERQVGDIEKHVTSREFELNRQFKQL